MAYQLRKAKAFLFVSNTSLYDSKLDPMHVYVENVNWGGDVAASAQEVAGRIGELIGVEPQFESQLDLGVTGLDHAAHAFLPVHVPRHAQLHALMAHWRGRVAPDSCAHYHGREDPRHRCQCYPHSIIHIDDMCDLLEPLLGAASIPAEVVNWAGDEVVIMQEWCDFAAELAGTTATIGLRPIPGVAPGNAGDPTKRQSITGPCRRDWRDAFRELYAQRHQGVSNQ